MKTTKNRIVWLAWLTALAVFAACSESDEPDPNPENRAPGEFGLNDPDNANNASIAPTLSWETATDSDGDAVTYDVYVDTASNPTILISSGLTETSFEIEERLHLTTQYYWKVVAKDGKGGQIESEVHSFTTRNISKGTLALERADFSARSGHTAEVFDGKIWVIAGQDDNRFLQDTWYTNDLVNWTEMLSDFHPRRDHTSVVYDGKIWLIGGYHYFFESMIEYQSVYYGNGSGKWDYVASLDFPVRSSHTSVVYDDRIWVIGGYNKYVDGNQRNDVRYSRDGKAWEKATTNAQFAARYEHTSVVFKDKLWVIGGLAEERKNDVWYSDDGITWETATEHAEFSPRWGHTSVVYDDKIWVIGGDDGSYKNDVWYSSDGITWEKAMEHAEFDPRRHLTAVATTDFIVVIGGYGGAYYNDVWYLD